MSSESIRWVYICISGETGPLLRREKRTSIKLEKSLLVDLVGPMFCNRNSKVSQTAELLDSQFLVTGQLKLGKPCFQNFRHHRQICELKGVSTHFKFSRQSRFSALTPLESVQLTEAPFRTRVLIASTSLQTSVGGGSGMPGRVGL